MSSYAIYKYSYILTVSQPYSLPLILNCLFFSEFQENQAMKCHHNNEHGRIQTKYKQVTIT